ncbi:hypothetical protein F5Y08DRAFT_340092 [Xylaria arbuscula]|nr:hypothetical protein F5Y08DRAFT_340092 [Xylaria arbuscula]
MGFFDKLHSKLELYRLEKRYTRNRHRRSTFVSNAMYVDGEYVVQTPSSTGSSTKSSTVSTSRATVRRSVEMPTVPEHPDGSSQTTPPPSRKLHRFSSMPGFGSKTSRHD